jgi:serine/threonine-protein phosphatase PGAM5
MRAMAELKPGFRTRQSRQIRASRRRRRVLQAVARCLFWAFTIFFGVGGVCCYAQDSPERTIILVRHGAYNEAGSDNAHASLTPLGIAQARLVANRLLTLAPTPTVLVASTMTRALQTEKIIHEALPAVAEQRSELLRECMPPLPRNTKIALPSRSEGRACQDRLNQAFAIYFQPVARSETDILVCHGNVIRYFLMKALGANTGLWLHFSVGNTSITEIRVRRDGSMHILSVGDVGHLPSIMQSGTGARTPELMMPNG